MKVIIGFKNASILEVDTTITSIEEIGVLIDGIPDFLQFSNAIIATNEIAFIRVLTAEELAPNS